MNGPPDMTIKDVAAYLRVSDRTVRQWAYDRRIPSYQLGRRRMFRKSDIELFIEEHRIEADKK